jgi:periplasmic protein TonB
MPHEMFGDVALRPSSVRSRRSPVVVISILVHVVVLGALFIAPLMAADVLPIPRRALDLILPHEVMPIVVAVAPAKAASTVRSAPQTNAAPSTGEAAPIVAPSGIGPETGNAGAATGSGGTDVVVPGAMVGLPGANTIEPAPTPAPAPPVRLHAGIQQPQKLVDVRPIYPEIARAAHAEGMVIIEATIDVRGNVTAARVLKSHALLDAAALEAVRQWKFTPTRLNGVPTPIIMTVTVNFQLR